VNEDNTLNVPAPGVLAGDNDVDGDPLTASKIAGPSHGTATLNADGSFSYTPAANFNGSDSFTYKANDGTVDSNLATVTITVNPVNDNPTVAANNGSVTVDEGQTAQNTGTWADIDGDDVTLTASRGTVTKNAGGTWSWSFATNDSDQSGLVTITANDGNGGTVTATFSLVVNNLNPSVTITSPAVGTLYTMGSTVNVSATFGDLGTGDTHTCEISWDNGLGTTTGTVNEINGSGTCTGSKQLTQNGVYTIRVTVTDDDGGSGFDETLVVVYDPNVGHVTGGGWINSPAGAYRADLTLEGRANFGFNAKYLKGAKTPTGSTEFQFKAGNLNFHSSLYEWLVVSGAKGQFKGTGTINGGGNYGFLLTVTDGQLSGGGTDKFRIKIWDKNAADAIAYDNASAGGDDIDSSSTQEIASGSIVIHKGK
jgi:VCBS repeat-containing protein